MLCSRGRVWVVAVALAAGPGIPCGRAAAQEPPEGKPEAPPETPAARVQHPPAENGVPEPASKRSPRAGDVQKVFVIRNVPAGPLAEVLAVFPATITVSKFGPSTQFGVSAALGVSAPPAVLAAIEETIKRLDVPRLGFRNIELTAEVLEALPVPAEATSLSPELQGVVDQLKKTFSFAAYRLADTLFVRAREEEGLDTEGTSANDFVGVGKLNYHLGVRTAFITASAGGGTVVHLDRLHFTVTSPKLEQGSVEVSGVDIHEGQRVVVGNSGLGAPGSAIILVLSAKVVD
jgi:hypothetical protein